MYIYTYVCVCICGYIQIYAHTLTDIYICMYLRGSLAFLPISQSEGPTMVVCILVEKGPGLPVPGSSLKMVSILPRSCVCRIEKGLAWHRGVLHGLRPVGWLLPRLLLAAALCGSRCPALEFSVGRRACIFGGSWASLPGTGRSRTSCCLCCLCT